MTGAAPRPAVAELRVADGADVWTALGFAVEDGLVRVGTVAIRLLGAGAGSGIVGWVLRGGTTTELDGLATELTSTAAVAAGAAHPNGARSIDHVVVGTPDRARTSAVLDAAGLGLRRVREEVRGPGPAGEAVVQAFHRAGEVIVEVVGPPAPDGDGPAAFWGLVVTVDDLDAAVAAAPERFGTVRDAVQPGRRIATVRRQAGSSVRLAFMSV